MVCTSPPIEVLRANAELKFMLETAICCQGAGCAACTKVALFPLGVQADVRRTSPMAAADSFLFIRRKCTHLRSQWMSYLYRAIGRIEVNVRRRVARFRREHRCLLLPISDRRATTLSCLWRQSAFRMNDQRCTSNSMLCALAPMR